MAIQRADFPLPDVDDPLTAPYFAGAARGELRDPALRRVRRVTSGIPSRVCPACGGALAWTPVSGRGTLFSWAVVRRPFLPAFAEQVPFVTALVALDEDPAVRIVDVRRRRRARGARRRPAASSSTSARSSFPTVPDRSVIVPMFRPRP